MASRASRDIQLLGWAAEIERTTPPDSTPVNEFFRLIDAYRADTV